MKHLAIAFVCLAMPAFAQTPGIQFDQMPVGCRIHGLDSTGSQAIDEYVGAIGNTYVMKSYIGPAGTTLIRTLTYSRDGLLVRRDWVDGRWDAYDPGVCRNVPGPCNYIYRTNEGDAYTYDGLNTVDGDQIVSHGGWVGSPQIALDVATIGRFNIPVAYREDDYWYKTTRYENCEVNGGS